MTVSYRAHQHGAAQRQRVRPVLVPEIARSVFIVPAAAFKTRRDHVVILNDAAWSIVQAQRGLHPIWVFSFRGHRIGTMNNNGWPKARREVGLRPVRVHDLRHNSVSRNKRHTFGQRLRDAGVPQEDHALLLGHAIEGMPQHYSSATVARLAEAANKAQEPRDRTTLLRVVNG